MRKHDNPQDHAHWAATRTTKTLVALLCIASALVIIMWGPLVGRERLLVGCGLLLLGGVLTDAPAVTRLVSTLVALVRGAPPPPAA